MPFVDKVVFDLEKEGVPLQAKFLQGYYDSPAIERLDYGTGMIVAMSDDKKKEKEYREQGHPAADDDRGEQLVHRLQLAGPGRRQGRHAGAGGAQSQAAPGAVDRHRLGRVHRDLRARAGRGGAGTAAAVAVRLSRRRTVGVQSGGLPQGVDGKPVRRSDRGGEEAARRGGLSRRPRREDRQAAGAQLRLSVRADARASRRCSTGTRSSSRRSACSSRSARPTTTASRTR